MEQHRSVAVGHADRTIAAGVYDADKSFGTGAVWARSVLRAISASKHARKCPVGQFHAVAIEASTGEQVCIVSAIESVCTDTWAWSPICNQNQEIIYTGHAITIDICSSLIVIT